MPNDLESHNCSKYSTVDGRISNWVLLTVEVERVFDFARCSAVAVKVGVVACNGTSAVAVWAVIAGTGPSVVAVYAVGACIGSSAAGKGPAVGMVVKSSSGIAVDCNLADLAHSAVEDNMTGHIVAGGKQLEPDSCRLWHNVLLQRGSL